MKIGYWSVLLVILGIILLSYFAIRNSLSVWSSPERQFNVTPGNIWLNWTNQNMANITITANESFNVTVEILNENTSIAPFYGQNDFGECEQFMTPDNCTAAMCVWTNGVCTNPCYSLNLWVTNESGEYDNVIGPINGSDSSNITLTNYFLSCFAGRYYGGLTIRNNTDASENLTINITIDIPLLLSVGGGFFSGEFPANSTDYHSYYFNTSGVPNATSTFVVLSSFSKELNLFLFDQSGNLKEKVINMEITPNIPPDSPPYTGFLVYPYLPENETWEIRIYGNISNSSIYMGGVFITTLNVTDTDSGDRIDLIDFDDMNVSDSKVRNITLKNEGNTTIENVGFFVDMPAMGPSERGNIGFYHEETFQDSGDGEFNFLVVNSSIEIIAVMNWTGASRYNISLYKPDGNLFKFSYNESNNANMTNAMQEEFVLVNASYIKEGFWKIKIKNTTSSAESYTLKAWVFYDSNQYISTNFTEMDFNVTGSPNSSQSFYVNFTAPNNLPDGAYRGNFMFFGNDAPSLVVPFEFNLMTPMLVVNNSIKNSTVKIHENIGSNLTREFSVIINNTGTYDLSLTSTNSSVLSRDATRKMGLSYSVPETIPAHSSGLLNVSIDINMVNTSDMIGQYRGWIYLNASDSTPYPGFNLSIQVNLTNQINVEVINIVTNNTGSDDNVIYNSSLGTNVKLIFNAFYINGTKITGNTICENAIYFKKIWLYQPNASYIYPTSGSLSFTNSTEACDPADLGNYTINVTIPAGRIGGTYEIHALVNTSGNKLTGESSGPEHLLVNNSGLYMSIVGEQPPYTMLANTTKIINVTINNYGLLNATNSKIKLDKKNCIYRAIYSHTNCNITYSGTEFTIESIPSENASVCYVAWEITSALSAASCTPTINGTAGVWFNSLAFGLNVTETTNPPINPEPNITQPVYNYSLIFTQAESPILIKQNSTNSTVVVVKNIGNISQLVNFSILTLSSSWYTLNSTSVNISANSSKAFLVTFSVGIVDMQDYIGVYRAASKNKVITKDFTLRVLPSDENRTYINDMITTYRTQMLNFSNVINQSKQEYNTTEAEDILQDLVAKIQEAEGYISQNDYESAYLTLGIIESLVQDTRDAIGSMQKLPETDGGGGIVFGTVEIIIITIVVVSAIVLAYLFWPTKAGYSAGKKKYVYKSKGEENREKLKEKWMEIIKKKK